MLFVLSSFIVVESYLNITFRELLNHLLVHACQLIVLQQDLKHFQRVSRALDIYIAVIINTTSKAYIYTNDKNLYAISIILLHRKGERKINNKWIMCCGIYIYCFLCKILLRTYVQHLTTFNLLLNRMHAIQQNKLKSNENNRA